VACHPPLHLRDDQVWINDQPAPLPPEATGTLPQGGEAQYARAITEEMGL